MVDYLKDSIEFWRRHPEVLAKFRPLYKSGKVCEWCEGDKYVIVPGAGRFACPCRIIELEAEDAQKYRLLSHIRPEEKAMTFDGLKPWDETARWATVKNAVTDLQSLVKSPYNHQWIKLNGVPGSGKSHAMLAAYNRISHAAIFVQAGYLADRIHKGLDRKGEHTEEWLEINDLKEHLVEVPVLFLDDLGEEHDSAFVNSTITDIIVRRYQCGRSKPTVVSTNLAMDDLSNRYTRLASRLQDTRLVLQHNLLVRDYRKKGSNGGPK